MSDLYQRLGLTDNYGQYTVILFSRCVLMLHTNADCQCILLLCGLTVV